MITNVGFISSFNFLIGNENNTFDTYAD
jgi:hypothetical protein